MAKLPYDRLPEESAPAFEAFALYRDMGVERSTDEVARQLGKSSALIQRWSSTHRWVERVTAWDNYIDQQARKRIEKNAIQRRVDMLTRHAQAGKALQSYGLKHIQKNPAAEKGSDAISAIQRGVEMERKSEGLPEYLISVVDKSNDDLLRQYHDLLTALGNQSENEENSDSSEEPNSEI